MTSRNDPEHPAQSSAPASPPLIAVVASKTSSLTNFRFQLLAAMRNAGHRVVALAPEIDQEVIGRLKGIGVDFIPISMGRTGVNPFADVRTLWSLWRRFHQLKPDIVIPYTMKPIIYGLLAARLAGVRRRFALITGMGYVFTAPRRTPWMRALHTLSVRLYRLGLSGAERVFVYNPSDEQEVRENRLVDDPSRIVVIPGSGVDLEHFAPAEPPREGLTFLLVARLLADKGIHEYVEAARRLRQRFPKVRCQLLGPFDSNPAGIPRSLVEAWAAEGVVEYLGETSDVRPFLNRASVFVLPSYREGIPRSTQEAMALGRAIITTDAPGCRETVIDGVNGWLVPTRDPQKLAEAMETFATDPGLVTAMGRKSRELASERFDVHAINRVLLGYLGLEPPQLKK